MVSVDKRDECDCHRQCTTLLHDCEKPCIWPKCLTEWEHTELTSAITMEDS